MSVKRNNECRGVVIQFKVNPRLCRGTHRGLTYATVATKYISLPLEGGGRRWGCRVNGVHGPSRLTPIPIPARGARKARAPARRGKGPPDLFRFPPRPPSRGKEKKSAAFRRLTVLLAPLRRSPNKPPALPGVI